MYAHLTKRSSDDQAYDVSECIICSCPSNRIFQSARELTAVTWAQELATCLRQCDSILSKTGDDEDMDETVDNNLPQFASKAKAALRGIWKESTSDMFDLG